MISLRLLIKYQIMLAMDSLAHFVLGARSLLVLHFGSDKALFDLSPVDDLPHGGQVLWSGILVVEVVCMLPDVNIKDWNQIWVQVSDQVLVGGSSEAKSILLFVIDEPSPSRALDGCGSSIEHSHEVLKGAPSFDDVFVQLRTFLWKRAVSLWAERVPEELVVEMTTSVEFDLL